MTDLLPFERWARISAALTVTGDDLREVHLERWGFTTEEWNAQEVAWTSVLAAELVAGRTERAFDYGKMCADVRKAKQIEAAGPSPADEPSPDRAGEEDDGDVTHFGSAVAHEPTLPFNRNLASRVAAALESPAAVSPAGRPAVSPAGPARAEREDRGDETQFMPTRSSEEPALPFQPKRGT